VKKLTPGVEKLTPGASAILDFTDPYILFTDKICRQKRIDFLISRFPWLVMGFVDMQEMGRGATFIACESFRFLGKQKLGGLDCPNDITKSAITEGRFSIGSFLYTFQSYNINARVGRDAIF
jgi:hypothetical protein